MLSPPLDGQPLDADYLAAQLDERLQDLGAPAGALVEPLIGSDPTLETLKVAEALQPASAPRRLHEVWFDRAGKRALLAVQTRAAGFDTTGQQRSEGRGVGKECVSTCRSRWSAYHEQKNNQSIIRVQA